MSCLLASQSIRDAAALAALEPEWWALWRRSPCATPFQCPAWLLPWWRAFGPGELNVLVIRAGARLVALAPFYLETGPRGRRVLPIGIPVTDYHDVLIDPEFPDSAAAALSRQMTETGTWDEWEFPELAPAAEALRVPVPSGCIESLEPTSACPVLVLPNGIDHPQAVYPTRKRRALRTAQNRAACRGTVELMAGNPQTALDVLEALVRLHRARWISRGESGVLSDPRVRQFHREAIPQLMDAGVLRLYLLRIGGDIAAVYYGLFHRDRSYGYLTGFDPAYQFESPSVILLGHVIAESVREGACEFHFLRGKEPYKYGWGAVDRWNQRRVFRRVSAYACAS